VLIPLNLDNHMFKWSDGKAEALRARFAPSFVGWAEDSTKRESSLAQVVTGLAIVKPPQKIPPPSRL
jgi:hypothetical protein